MKKRPRTLTYLALLLFGMAVSLPVQVMFLHHHNPFELISIVAKLAPLNLAIIFLAPITAWLLLRASTASIAAMFILACVVIYNNWLTGEIGSDYSQRAVWIGNLLFVLAFSPLFSRKIFGPILNPKLRWWMTPQRWQVPVPIRLKLLARQGPEIITTTFDVSEGGAFVPYAISPKDLKIGTQCYVSLPLQGIDHLQCRGEVVRLAQARGQYPSGFGIRFLGMTWAERKKLLEFIKVQSLEQTRKQELGPLRIAA